MMIAINDDLALDEREISETFIRASGPGGQNVNKVASAAQLRFLLPLNTSLPVAARNRLRRLAACGFSPATARHLSDLHTPNLM